MGYREYDPDLDPRLEDFWGDDEDPQAEIEQLEKRISKLEAQLEEYEPWPEGSNFVRPYAPEGVLTDRVVNVPEVYCLTHNEAFRLLSLIQRKVYENDHGWDVQNPKLSEIAALLEEFGLNPQ